jgi:serine/threonine protein kinase
MPNGSVGKYFRTSSATVNQRLKWAIQAAEGLVYMHQKNVLHCDFYVGNLLLDKDLSINLCDFQGRLLDPGGEVL